jgi:hypothetical protein
MTLFRRFDRLSALILSFVVVYAANRSRRPLAATRSFLWKAEQGSGSVVYSRRIGAHADGGFLIHSPLPSRTRSWT